VTVVSVSGYEDVCLTGRYASLSVSTYTFHYIRLNIPVVYGI
jgi:hypothetical protein